MKTDQVKFWESEFGQKYTERNTYNDLRQWDQQYIAKINRSRLESLTTFLSDIPRDIRILEVGCNTGMQLIALQSLGFKHLYGVELQWYAVEKAQQLIKDINVIQGSGFDLPFKDNFFDLVMTNGVLIHISPDDLKAFTSEIFRCSKRYVMGYEYYSDEMTAIDYRGNFGFLWKSDYKQFYIDNFKGLKEVGSEFYSYVNDNNQGNKDHQFLLEKIN